MLGNSGVMNVIHRATTKVVTHVTAHLTVHLMANDTAHLVTHLAARLMAKILILYKTTNTIKDFNYHPTTRNDVNMSATLAGARSRHIHCSAEGGFRAKAFG
jgi:hypothetical protein